MLRLRTLLTDLREFVDAHQIYTQGLHAHSDAMQSPPAGGPFRGSCLL
jgi:hypothetical protein